MEKYLIANTTKEERIALIRSWIPDDEVMDGCDIDLWDMYADYINGKKGNFRMQCGVHAGLYRRGRFTGDMSHETVHSNCFS